MRAPMIWTGKKSDVGGGVPFVFDLFLIGNGHLFYNVSSHVGEQTCVDEGAISCQRSPTQFVSSHSMAAVSANINGLHRPKRHGRRNIIIKGKQEENK